MVTLKYTLNTYFETAVSSLEFNENTFILTETTSSTGPVENSIKNTKTTLVWWGCTEKLNVHISTPFKISEVTYEEIPKEVNNLDNKKPATISNIASERLKEASEICNKHLLHFWNNEKTLNCFPLN